MQELVKPRALKPCHSSSHSSLMCSSIRRIDSQPKTLCNKSQTFATPQLPTVFENVSFVSSRLDDFPSCCENESSSEFSVQSVLSVLKVLNEWKHYTKFIVPKWHQLHIISSLPFNILFASLTPFFPIDLFVDLLYF